MTESTSADRFFADILVPLHHSNRRRGLHYFASGSDGSVASYWEAPASRTGGVERLGIGDGDGAALLARLAEFWIAQGDPVLPRLLPDLEALWNSLFEPEAQPGDASGTVPLTVYPLF